MTSKSDGGGRRAGADGEKTRAAGGGREVSQSPTRRLPSRPDGDEGAGDPGRFATGSLVTDRYLVCGLLGHGGMGEVWEVEDRVLRGRLALKTILPEIAADPLALERFKREIHLARKVTHPNVCRIFDIGFHPAGSSGEEGSGRRTLFLTMELLRGETLAQRIYRGRLPLAEALPLVRQMADGLAAAHEAGIIHRDFKSSNVMLVEPDTPGPSRRAVITDFGLARPSTHGVEAELSLSGSGGVVGTPAYMAPEQVQGLPLTPAADIYALGVVLFEMVTGAKPFQGGSPITSAARRVFEAPPSPRSRVPDLDPVWEDVILKCLAREPEGRFRDAREVSKALAGAAGGSAPPTPSLMAAPTVSVPSPDRPDRASGAAPGPWSRRRSHRALLAVGGTLLLAGAAILLKPVLDRSPAVPAAAPAPGAVARPVRRAVAVLAPVDASHRPATTWMATALGEMLGSELAAGDGIRLVPLSEAAAALRDLDLTGASSLTGADARRLGARLGADVLLAGSYGVVGSGEAALVRIDVRAVDARDGAVVGTATATGSESQLFALVSRAGGTLRQALGLAAVTPAESLVVEAVLPATAAARRGYSEGISLLWSFDAVGARAALEKAVAAEPGFAPARGALAAAYALLGYQEKARNEARQALALSSSLPEREGLWIAARLHSVSEEWDKAAEAYAALLRASPDSVDAGLALADARTRTGRSRDALVTLAELRKLPAPMSSDPRVDFVEARAYQELGDPKRQRALAASAAKRSRETGARHLLARALQLEATALESLGEYEPAFAAIEEARALFLKSGDAVGAARCNEQQATALFYKGDLDGARRLYDRAGEIYREAGDRTSYARALKDRGYVLLRQGHLAEADRLFRDSLAAFREAGARFEAGATLNAIGVRLLAAGDLAGAERRYAEAIRVFEEIGERSGTAIALTNVGEIQQLRGDLDGARKMHEEALALNREIGDQAGAAADQALLAEVFAAKGDLVAARQRLVEARTAQEKVGDRLGAADSTVALARLDLAEGKAAEAEAAATRAEEVLRVEGIADRAILALAVVARARLEQGKMPAASEAAAQLRSRAAGSADARARLVATITAARIDGATADTTKRAAAARELRESVAAARKSGFAGIELEARLDVAQLELVAGDRNANASLRKLAEDARAKGYGLVARKAAALAG